jgi:hypothetical protein
MDDREPIEDTCENDQQSPTTEEIVKTEDAKINETTMNKGNGTFCE